MRKNGSSITSLCFFVSFIVALVSSPAEATKLSEARVLLAHGAYGKAEARLRALGARGALDLSRLYLETGRPAQALKVARSVARGRRRVAALTLVGEAQRAAGHFEAARKTFEAVIAQKGAFRARIRLALVYRRLGKEALAKAIFDAFYDAFGNDKIDKKSPAQLTYVAMACRYTDNFRDAHDTLRDALKIDSHFVEAWNELGEISLEKYEAGHAEQHFLKVLAINPKNVRALIGLARVKMVQTNRVKPLYALLAKIRAVDPKNVTAAAIEASTLIDNDAYVEAEALLKKALVRQPTHVEAISILAASHFLRDDRRGFARLEKRALKLAPKDTRFYHRVIALAVRKHRYAEAIDLGKKAVKINPEDWHALADIGTNYLRSSDEVQGLKYLKKAWQGDQFNVKTYNLLNLWDDVLTKSYTFARSKHFRLRAHKDEIALLARTVLPLLEEGFTYYRRKYGYTPKLPITVELFRKPSHFAIRTFGLPPDPGAIGGVTFGRLVTSMSPSLRRFNWGQVLWHELNHVFTVEMSRHRVPRWLTEGLAVMEAMGHRREWKRENDFDVYAALKAGRLTPLSKMNTAFTRQGLRGVLVAYYQGALLARFLIKTYGIAKMRRVLLAYAKGQRTPQIFPHIFGKSTAALDKEFRARELIRLAPYQKSFFVDLGRYAKLDTWVARAKAHPGDARAQIDLAAAYLAHGRGKAFLALVPKLAKLAPHDKTALFLRIQGARRRGKAQEGKRLLRELIAAGGDGYFARLELGRIAIMEKDLATAEKDLALAKRFDPERKAPYTLLAAAYQRAGAAAKAIAELEGIVARNQQSVRAVMKLMALLVKAGAWARVRTYGQMAYYLDPFSEKLHQMLATAYEKPAPRPMIKRAIWHLETALLTHPKDPKALHRSLAALYGRRGQHAKAKRHALLAK